MEQVDQTYSQQMKMPPLQTFGVGVGRSSFIDGQETGIDYKSFLKQKKRSHVFPGRVLGSGSGIPLSMPISPKAFDQGMLNLHLTDSKNLLNLNKKK